MFPSEHKTKLVRKCSVPVCPFQKLERGWDEIVVFPFELGLNSA